MIILLDLLMRACGCFVVLIVTAGAWRVSAALVAEIWRDME